MMRSFPIVCVILVIIFEVHREAVWVAAAEKTCRAVVQDLTKLQLQLVAKCAKTMKFKNGKDKSKKQNCILRCAMINAELTDKEGQVSPASVEFLLTKFVPEYLQPKANSTFWPCMDIGFKEPFKTPEEDPFCSSYDPFIKCFMQQASNFCT